MYEQIPLSNRLLPPIGGAAVAVALLAAWPGFLFEAWPIVLVIAIFGVVVGRWWALLIPGLAGVAALVSEGTEPDGTNPGASWAAAMVPAAVVVLVGVCARKLAVAALQDAGTADSLPVRLLGRPAEPEPVLELQSGVRAMLWFAGLFALLLAGVALAVPQDEGAPTWLVAVGGLAILLTSFGLPPRRRRVAAAVLLALAAVPVLGYAALKAWYMVAELACTPEAYECPI